MPYKEWKDVFKLALKVAKELREKNPKLTFPESTKAAWKDPRVKAAHAEYNKYKAEKGTPVKKKPAAKKKKPKK